MKQELRGVIVLLLFWLVISSEAQPNDGSGSDYGSSSGSYYWSGSDSGSGSGSGKLFTKQSQNVRVRGF